MAPVRAIATLSFRLIFSLAGGDTFSTLPSTPSRADRVLRWKREMLPDGSPSRSEISGTPRATSRQVSLSTRIFDSGMSCAGNREATNRMTSKKIVKRFIRMSPLHPGIAALILGLDWQLATGNCQLFTPQPAHGIGQDRAAVFAVVTAVAELEAVVVVHMLERRRHRLIGERPTAVQVVEIAGAVLQ